MKTSHLMFISAVFFMFLWMLAYAGIVVATEPARLIAMVIGNIWLVGAIIVQEIED